MNVWMETEKETYRQDVAALLQNALAWSVGVTAVTQAESEYCQSTVVLLELCDDEWYFNPQLVNCKFLF